MEISLDYPSGPKVMTMSLNVEEGGRRVSVREMQCEKDLTRSLLALKLEGYQEPRNIDRQPLEFGKGRKADFPLEPPERNADIFISAQYDPF